MLVFQTVPNYTFTKKNSTNSNFEFTLIGLFYILEPLILSIFAASVSIATGSAITAILKTILSIKKWIFPSVQIINV